MIADLTGQNPNVFYELAVRHTIGKPFIHLMTEGETIPFDIQGLRTIFLDHKDLDSVDDAKRSLMGMIQKIESGEEVETPVKYTMDWQQLRQSESSQDRGIADLMEDMHIIKRAVLNTIPRRTANADHSALQHFVASLAKAGRLEPSDREILISEKTSTTHDQWVIRTIAEIEDPWTNTSPTRLSTANDEPPF